MAFDLTCLQTIHPNARARHSSAVGWRWVLVDHLVIRANIGYLQTLGSSTTVESPDFPEAAALATPIADAELGKIYEDYVKLPTVGLSAGYRF